MSKRSTDLRRKGDMAGLSGLTTTAARFIELQGPACGRFMR
ncbi:hypothetical protein [Labrenzia sp. VG12]|nr:hypothetical protein [Labrenzia sp. VG12]